MRKIFWIILGSENKRRFFTLTGMLLLFLSLCGCGRKLPGSEQVVKQYLKEKYNQEFQIVHIEKKNIGQNFGKYINIGEASPLDVADAVFSFTIYEDGRITDNYPKVLFGDQIKKDIYSILDDGKLKYTNVDIRFIESDQVYTTVEDYKSNHNVLIFSNLKGLETNINMDVGNAYDLLCALRDQGYYFCVTISMIIALFVVIVLIGWGILCVLKYQKWNKRKKNCTKLVHARVIEVLEKKPVRGSDMLYKPIFLADKVCCCLPIIFLVAILIMVYNQ